MEKENVVLDKKWIKEKLSIIYLPFLLQLVLLVFFFIGIDFMFQSKVSFYFIYVCLWIIPILVLIHCYYGFKTFAQLVDKKYVSFFSILGMLINIGLVIFNFYICYILVYGLIEYIG